MKEDLLDIGQGTGDAPRLSNLYLDLGTHICTPGWDRIVALVECNGSIQSSVHPRLVDVTSLQKGQMRECAARK
jgi:hypothetical protein